MRNFFDLGLPGGDSKPSNEKQDDNAHAGRVFKMGDMLRMASSRSRNTW